MRTARDRSVWAGERCGWQGRGRLHCLGGPRRAGGRGRRHGDGTDSQGGAGRRRWHAGEGGLFGSEEQTIIAPAIAAARAQGLDVSGPIAPDTVFMRARNTPAKPGEFDVVVAMYHDQGLIPVKYLGVEQGVNVTLGL